MNTDLHSFILFRMAWLYYRLTAIRLRKRHKMHQRNSKHLGLSNLCKSVFICGSFLLVLSAGGAAVAQRGGKAEPNRIAFKRGATSKMISGTVRGDEQAEYVLAAKKGQELIVHVTSTPRRTCLLELHGPENADLAFSQYDYRAALPATGDYLLIVLRPTESKGTSRYKWTVTVR